MKNLWITIFTFGVFFITNAQSGFGVHGGLVATGLFNVADGANQQFKSNSGIMVGVRCNLKLGPIAFCPELNYVMKKYDHIGQYNYYGEVIEFASPTEFTMNYISIPLLGKLYLGPVNIYTGIQTSLLLSGTVNDEEFNISDNIDDEEYYFTIGDEEYWLFEDMDVAAVFGLGLDLNMGLYLNARVSVSVTPLVNMTLISDWADETNVSENDIADYITGGTEGTDGLNHYVTTQLTIGYAF